MRVLAAVIASMMVAAPSPARGQGATVDRTRPPSREEMILRRQLGVLTYVPITIEFEATPARAAFEWLQVALGIPLVGRYADDPTGHGIDPDLPITLSVTERPALELLELMLEACSTSEPCTWQMRKGFVEFGTKRRLSAPAARRTRLYYIADLIIDIPDNTVVRTRREVLALDLVRDIVENIEPGDWDWGQQEEPVEPRLTRADETRTPVTGTGAEAPRYVAPRKIAIIRYWRDFLIIHAPDYIHRQINGYPRPIPPHVPTRTRGAAAR